MFQLSFFLFKMLRKSHAPMFPPPTVPHPITASPLFSLSPCHLWAWPGGRGSSGCWCCPTARAVGARCSPTRWVNAGPGQRLGGKRPDLGRLSPEPPGWQGLRGQSPGAGPGLPVLGQGVGQEQGSVTELPPSRRRKPPSAPSGHSPCALLLFWEVANLGNARRPEELARGAGAGASRRIPLPVFGGKHWSTRARAAGRIFPRCQAGGSRGDACRNREFALFWFFF